MARFGYGLLGVVASAVFAATSLTPAFAEQPVTAPAQVQEEQIATSSTAALPAALPNARAEVTRPAAPQKPKAVQANYPHRSVVVAERARCWLFCGHQMVLMLGVAY
jgi:hypothetical protein